MRRRRDGWQVPRGPGGVHLGLAPQVLTGLTPLACGAGHAGDLAAAVVHGLLVDPVLKVSAPLKTAYLVVGGIGIAAYVYRELFARFADVQRPNEMTADVFLQPARRLNDASKSPSELSGTIPATCTTS